MASLSVENVQRPPRGANSPWRQAGGSRPGRAVPTLAPGPPPERAVYVYRVLCRDAGEQRKRRYPQVRTTVRELARRAQTSRATAARMVLELEAAGWLQVTRTRQPGYRGGQLQGPASCLLVYPADGLGAEGRRPPRPPLGRLLAQRVSRGGNRDC